MSKQCESILWKCTILNAKIFLGLAVAGHGGLQLVMAKHDRPERPAAATKDWPGMAFGVAMAIHDPSSALAGPQYIEATI